MEKLKEYDAVIDLQEKDYFEILVLSGYNHKICNDFARTAKNMGGIFWSGKYKLIMFGKFRKQNVLTKSEFVKRLKKTVQ